MGPRSRQRAKLCIEARVLGRCHHWMIEAQHDDASLPDNPRAASVASRPVGGVSLEADASIGRGREPCSPNVPEGSNQGRAHFFDSIDPIPSKVPECTSTVVSGAI